jgi:hypothetical protein
MVFAGLLGPSVAILRLASGDPRLIALMCRSDVTDGQGTILEPALCSPQGDIWTQYLVGA